MIEDEYELCTIPGCDDNVHNVDMCKVHYDTWYNRVIAATGVIHSDAGPLRKRCLECKRWLSVTAFDNESGLLDGLRPNCRECDVKLLMIAGYLPPLDKPSEEYLYRLYDRAGTLLYVGITSKPLNRLREHRQQPWWPEVDLVKLRLERFESRNAVLLAERTTIQAEHPLYNIQGRDRLSA